MKHSDAFTKTFLSVPQLNPANSGKGKNGNYKRSYSKTLGAAASREQTKELS